MFDHVLVDDYQDATFGGRAAARVELRPASLVVAGNPGAHVFSFQGTTDRAAPAVRGAVHRRGAGSSSRPTIDPTGSRPRGLVRARTRPRSTPAIARELRRLHVEEGVPWRDLARDRAPPGAHLRRASCGRSTTPACPGTCPRRGLALAAEPATVPYAARAPLAGDPRRARRAGRAGARRPSSAGSRRRPREEPAPRGRAPRDGRRARRSSSSEALSARRARTARARSRVHARPGRGSPASVLDAFSLALWRELPCSRRPRGRRRDVRGRAAGPRGRRSPSPTRSSARQPADDPSVARVPRAARGRRGRPGRRRRSATRTPTRSAC